MTTSEHSSKRKRGDTTGRPNAFSSLLEPAIEKFFEKISDQPQRNGNSRRQKAEKACGN
jgi:hypothetical protein